MRRGLEDKYFRFPSVSKEISLESHFSQRFFHLFFVRGIFSFLSDIVFVGGSFSFWFNLSIIISFVSIYFIYQLANKPRPPDYYILAFWCTLIVLSSNFAVAVQFIKYPARALATSLVAAALMLLVANQESTSLATQLMSKYGFGGKQTITLIVKPTDEC